MDAVGLVGLVTVTVRVGAVTVRVAGVAGLTGVAGVVEAGGLVAAGCGGVEVALGGVTAAPDVVCVVATSAPAFAPAEFECCCAS